MPSTQWTPVSCSVTLNFLSASVVAPLQTYTGTSIIRYQKQPFTQGKPGDTPTSLEADEDRAYFDRVRQQAAETGGLHLYAYTEKHSLFPPTAVPLVLEGVKVAAVPSGKNLPIASLKDAEIGKDKNAPVSSGAGKTKNTKSERKKGGKQNSNVERTDDTTATGATMQDVGSKLVYFEKEEELAEGAEVELKIQFKGTIQEADVGGIYCRALKEAEERAPVLLTHFEVHLARIAFPCPDHPQYRVLWELKSVQLPAAFHTVRSNGTVQEERHLNESTVYQFGKVGPLPAYVFAFAAFSGPPLEEVETQVTTHGGGEGAAVPLRVAVAAAATSHVPQEMLLYMGRIASEAVVYLEDFFQSPLPLLGCPELMILCVPTMPYISGMEHHGCIFLNEDIYKTPSGKGAAAAKKNAENQKVAQTELIIHEIIHHWIGNALGLPFSIKEGICLLLEQCFGDVLLGKPMRKIAAAQAPAPTTGKGGAASAAPSAHKTEEGKEFTGHSYQLALASLQQIISTIGFATFQNKMRRLLAVHLEPVLQGIEDEGGMEVLRMRGAYVQMPYLSTEEFLSFLSSDETAE